MTTWLTSDTHWNHLNILNYCKRPWTDIESMNEGLIERWNARVSAQDDVYHLGDFAMGDRKKIPSIVERLNGRIHLIKGNHDHSIEKYRQHFSTIQNYLELKTNGTKLILFHFPISVWNHAHHGLVHCHGHSHGSHKFSWPKTKDSGRRIDVGSDCWNWAPVSVEEVLALAETIAVKSDIDHHEEER